MSVRENSKGRITGSWSFSLQSLLQKPKHPLPAVLSDGRIKAVRHPQVGGGCCFAETV
jgi:hypothetical protein